MAARPKIVLLRGVNVGAANRIPMPALRDALSGAGFGDVRTYVQSGNILLETDLHDDVLQTSVGELIRTRFGLEIPVLARSVQELQEVVDANPLSDSAESDPKHFQVSFCSGAPNAEAVAELEGFAQEQGEPLAVAGRAIYAYHPNGIHASKVAARMTPKRLGVEQVSARNWATVRTLLEMARSMAAESRKARTVADGS